MKSKKFLSLTLAMIFIMAFAMSGTTFALTTDTEISPLQNENLTVSATEIDIKTPIGISPTYWSGTGPAPQVTKIELYDYGWLSNGNFYVKIKVTGYGSEYATFDGVRVKSINQVSFRNFGDLEDGWIYTYDCGEITSAGDYLFYIRMTSANPPYTQLTGSVTFTFD